MKIYFIEIYLFQNSPVQPLQMGVQQTSNAPDYQKMVVRQSRLNQQMHQTNEDVAMWQPTMVQAKCICDDMAIKK